MGAQRSRGVNPYARISAGWLGALLAALLCLTGFLERWERRTQDLRFELRGRRPTGARIVLAEIRDSTTEAWEDTPMHAWGGHYAGAIRHARAAQARLVGFDVIPAGYGGKEADEALTRALRQEAGHVILSNARLGPKPTNPFPTLLYAHPKQAADLGFVDAPIELDDVARRGAVYQRGASQVVPSFDAVLALRYRGQSPLDRGALRSLPEVAEKEGIGTFWINYVGPPKSFPSIALEDLAADRLSPDERRTLRNAIVLIGPAYSDDNDKHRGPGFASYYQGLEVHAHAVATLLDRRPLRRGPPGQETLLAAALGALVVAPVAFLPFGWGIAWTLAALFGWCWAAQTAFRADALWPVAGPLLSVGLAWVGQTGVRTVQETRRRRSVETMFGQHVSPAVVDRLLRDPAAAALGGERRLMTILFSDIRGFTARSEEMPPEEVVAQLNEYLAEMAECVFATDGTLDKYIGDGLMAFWNSPLEQPDHALRAVTTAWAMLRGLEQLNAEWARAGRPTLEIGIGLNSGEVLVGNLGSARRLNYTVIGHEVNLAARIEAANKELRTSILLGEATYERVRDRVRVRPHTVEIRGVRLPVQLYELLEFAACPAGVEREGAGDIGPESGPVREPVAGRADVLLPGE